MKLKKTSILLLNIKNSLVDDKIPLKQLFFSDENNSYFTLMMVAALSFIPTPFILPLISNFFGILMVIVSFQIMLGKKLGIPSKIANIKVKRQTLIKIIEKSNQLFKKIEFLTKHRLLFMFNSRTKINFINFLNFALSFLVLIPLPIVTNFPACSIILILLGLTNGDGLFIFMGLVLAIMSFVLVALICAKGGFMFGFLRRFLGL
jgi:hypothetical protein